jgi:hypothetical protein
MSTCRSLFASEYSTYILHIIFVSNSAKFGVCTVMGQNRTLVEAQTHVDPHCANAKFSTI